MITALITLADGIDSVSPDFVKSFLIMLAFIATLGGGSAAAFVVGKKSAGTAADPVHLKTPLDVREVLPYADKQLTESALTKIEQTIASMARENLRQHHATAHQVAEIIKVGEKRAERILSGLADTEQRMMTKLIEEIKDVHNRINPLGEKVAAHKLAVDWIKTQLASVMESLTQRLEKIIQSQAEDTRRLHGRIDDAVRLANQPNQPK
jgi:hypothetical protein